MLALGHLYLKGFIIVVGDASVYKYKKKTFFTFFYPRPRKEFLFTVVTHLHELNYLTKINFFIFFHPQD